MPGRSVLVSEVSERPSPVLLVNPRNEDHASLQSLFRGSRWKLQGAWTASDGLKAIRRNRYEIPVVICERCLPDGDWKLLLAELDKAAVRPSLIVSSRVADVRLWAEVLNLGAFDLLLSPPFVPEEVLRVTESAWPAWNSAVRPIAVARKDPGLARSLAHSGTRALAAGNYI
jgi:DNA-binding NtrC family response regulator